MMNWWKLGKVSFFVGAVSLLLLGGETNNVKAGVVEPAGEGYDDSYTIQKELDEAGEVTLVKGGTYYLYQSLQLRSNMKINAAGATIICEKPIAHNIPDQTNYKSAQNIHINGGIWKSKGEGYIGSSFKFTHAKKLKFTNMKIRSTNFNGHSIELVACKDVLIENCDISGVGKSEEQKKTEEAIQLDVADERTAPFLRFIPFKTEIADTLYNGAGCQNITIKKCKIVGNRGVTTNFSGYGKQDTYHKNIKILNNKITGLQAEAVALFNAASATVKDNRIETKRKGYGDAYTVGLHLAAFSRHKELTKGKFIIRKNTIYGGRQAIMMYSHSGIRYGATNIENNKLYCKAGSVYAIHAKDASIQQVTFKNNALKEYKEKN